ncbi:BgTH12-03744 [Blumeria graminis f. sp. triticale]|uniref:BgTH12-03744 n=1 Tax=Blumeria graminis f. sp. triticale TaxID=1689686 RepID=A0A9W4DD46_BLUGR|nr:BgTH12-03744 [Blumeria graminis f. sp. triticale]
MTTFFWWKPGLRSDRKYLFICLVNKVTEALIKDFPTLKRNSSVIIHHYPEKLGGFMMTIKHRNVWHPRNAWAYWGHLLRSNERS